MAHIMVDLETMGDRCDATIVSIGAVRFTLPSTNEGVFTAGRITDRFYCNVDLQSSIDAGLTVSGNTVYWWIQQGAAARGALEGNRETLTQALADFSFFWRDASVEHLWSHGASFDVAILKTAYANLGLQTPFKYNQDADDRTLFLITGTPPWDDLAAKAPGVRHNALYDAELQANAVMWAYEKIQRLQYAASLAAVRGHENPADSVMERLIRTEVN